MAAIVEVEGLKKHFGQVKAVDGISFNVEEGEIFGFLGPNGAGKSTTIKILCTLIRPTAGTVRVGGYDVMREPASVRRTIGVVFQDGSLDDRLTAAQNLYLQGMLYGLPRQLQRERSRELLEMVGLWEKRDDTVRTFSGGMRRRLEIARGLLHRPKVLFLDEPTLGLDPQTRAAIWDYIKKLRAEEGLTIFMTTHYMEEAENCNRIAIIDHGRIQALDTPDNLKRLVGGDVVAITPAGRAEDLCRLIQERFGLAAQSGPGGIYTEVADGASFIPKLAAGLGEHISSISLRRPTLEDVFLKMTGRAIRPESAGALESARLMVRRLRGR